MAEPALSTQGRSRGREKSGREVEGTDHNRGGAQKASGLGVLPPVQCRRQAVHHYPAALCGARVRDDREQTEVAVD